MLDDQHRDTLMDERLFKTAGLAILLPSAKIVLLMGFATWLGFLTARVPAGVIIAIGAAVVVLSALFVRYFHNRSVNLLIVAASGLTALLATYLGGVYAAVFLSLVVVLVISAVPNAYRLLAGYSMAALMGFTLLLNESFNPSPESLRMLMSLAVVPYPIALLCNSSLPADRARVKGLLLFLSLSLVFTLFLILEDGLLFNYVTVVLVGSALFVITWKLRCIPLPVGLGSLIAVSLVALTNGFTVGTVFAPFLLACMVIPFLLFGSALGLGGAFLILIAALIGLSQHAGELDFSLLIRVFFASAILVTCLYFVTAIRTEAEAKTTSLADFLKQSRWFTNASLGVVLVTTSLLVYLVVNTYDALKVQYESDTNLLNLERLIVDRETGQRGYLLTGDEAFLQPYREAEGPIQSLVSDLARVSNSDFVDTLKTLIETRGDYYQRTFDLMASGDRATLLDLISSGQGKAYTESLRALVESAEFETTAEKSRLEQRLLFTGLNLVLAIFLLLLFALLLGRNAASRYKEMVFEPLERLRGALSDARANELLRIDRSLGAAAEIDYVVSSAKEMAQRNCDNANALDLQKRILAFALRSAGLYACVQSMNTQESELSSGMLALVGYEDVETFENDLLSAEIFHPDDRQAVINYRLNNEAQAVTYLNANANADADADAGIVVRVIAKSGKVIWIRHKVRMMHIADQTYRVATWKDISALVDTRQALTHKADQLETAVDAAGLGILEFNHSTGNVRANPRGYQIYGLPESDLVDVNRLYECIHPEDLESVGAFIEGGVKTLQDGRVEYRLIVDGETRWCRASTRTVQKQDGEVVVHESVLDITDDKQREQALESALESCESAVKNRPRCSPS